MVKQSRSQEADGILRSSAQCQCDTQAARPPRVRSATL